MNNESKSNVNFGTLLSLTKGKGYLVILSVIFSSLASIASFIPYYSIYKIIEGLLVSQYNSEEINAQLMINLGWIAFAGVVINVLLYFTALMCSHLAAFGTIYKLKLEFATHLSKVPLAYHSP